jgi:hypothetical protein
MDVRALIAFLNRIKCWMPMVNPGIREEIDSVINQLKNSLPK